MGKNAKEDKMIRKKIISLAIFIMCLGAFTGASAKTWEFKNIGKAELPKHIVFEEGIQNILSFRKFGGIKKFFIRLGATNGIYYTMTYNNAQHFSYGWATSQTLGLPYLLENNLYTYKKLPINDLMDIIAQDLNSKIIQNNAIYKDENPLKKQKSGKKYCWKGTFSIPLYERGILYNEEYQMIISNDGYQVKMGIICYDGDIRNVSKLISGIINDIKLY